MDDNHLLETRNNVTTSLKQINKTGTVISQQTPPETSNDAQMALQGAMIKDPFTDPSTGTVYQYRLYALLGPYAGTCCHYRAVALYLTNDGQNFVRPILNQVEFPCGSGDKLNNIVHLGPGLPFKVNGTYYMSYSSYGPCNEPNQYLSSPDGVTNWAPGLSESIDFSDILYLDGTHKVYRAPDNGQLLLATRGWYAAGEYVSPPPNVDFGRFAAWLPVPNFPANSPWPPAGWTNYEANTRNWPKPQAHPATINGIDWANVIMDSPNFSTIDIYTTSAFNLNDELDAEAEPIVLSVNTGYKYNDCKHFAYFSYARDGRKFNQRTEAPFYQCGTYGVDPDGAYFFDNIGAIRSGDKYIHTWGAAKYGGKPGCPALGYVAGSQSIQAGYVKLDRYIANIFSNGNSRTVAITIPNDGNGSALHVNVEPFGAGAYLKAQIEDTLGNVISGFGLADCIGVTTDEVLNGVIRWNNTTLKTLAGQTVKIHFYGNNVNFYSTWLQADNITASYANLSVGIGQTVNKTPDIVTSSALVSANIVSGSLPAGITLNSTTGVLSGTATTLGSGTATIRFISYGSQVDTVLTWDVSTASCYPPTFSLPALIIGSVGSPISVTPSGVTNSPDFSFDLLNAGLTLNASTGQISGTPVVAGTVAVNVTATNSCGTVSHLVNIRITDNSVSVPSVIPEIMFGNGYVTFITTNPSPTFTSDTASTTYSLIDSFMVSTGIYQHTIYVTGSTTSSVCLS